MITPQLIVDMLNAVFRLDPACLGKLIEKRVPINVALRDADLPLTVTSRGDHQELGVLGVINGIAGLDGALIEAVYDEADRDRLTGFRLRGSTPLVSV